MATTTPRIIIADGDILAYRAASAAEKETNWGNGVWTLHSSEDDIRNILDAMVGALLVGNRIKHVEFALTSAHNFRTLVDPTYKGHRKKVRKPLLLNFAREYLTTLARCYIVPGLEGDDVIGLLASNPELNYIVWSPDKDLRTIPGTHLDNVTRKLVTVTEEEANYKWMTQTLTGDTSDGYPGCKGSGPKDAEKVLAKAKSGSLDDLWEVVVERYVKAGLFEDDALVQARLSRILRQGDYNFSTNRVNLWHNDFIQSPNGHFDRRYTTGTEESFEEVEEGIYSTPDEDFF